MAGILEGLKVIEMGHVVVVPAAIAAMADWGADVIKVEPLTGDLARGFKSIERVETTLRGNGGETSWYMTMLNRGKRGVAVNLKTDPGREIVYKLLKTYDIFVSNYEVASLERLKMDYATLSKINRRLVYGLVTGYGSRGPERNERGFDHTAAWARSGIQNGLAEPGTNPPMERGGMMDRVTGAHFLAGVLAAVLHREKTGEGQFVETSLYHAASWTVGEDIQAALLGTPLPGRDRLRAENPVFNYYRCKDGRFIQLAMLQSDLQWPGFCVAIGKPEYKTDPRFKDMDARSINCEDLVRALDTIFITKTLDEWKTILRANDCIFAAVAKATEVVKDPQALANDFFAEIDHPAIGRFKTINTPVQFLQNPSAIRTPGPELGQHTEEVLLEMGYSWEDIGSLKEQKVIL